MCIRDRLCTILFHLFFCLLVVVETLSLLWACRRSKLLCRLCARRPVGLPALRPVAACRRTLLLLGALIPLPLLRSALLLGPVISWLLPLIRPLPLLRRLWLLLPHLRSRRFFLRLFFLLLRGGFLDVYKRQL